MIGVIADDLAGAAEIAGIGWRHGLSAEVVLKGRPSCTIDMACVDTDSRSCSRREAARRVAAAAASLRKAGAKWIYKKVDSVLRGNVIAETEAAMKELGFDCALLIPANPGLGRTIEHGKYYVRGKPIHRTDFAKDPQHPRTSANVLDLLAPLGAIEVSVRKVGDTILESRINVGEVAGARDLRWWAGQGHPKMLMAGGAEFFGALLKTRAGVRHARTEKVAKPVHEVSLPITSDNPGRRNACSSSSGAELFVCGSLSESTQAFVHAARRSNVPVFSLGEHLGRSVKFGPNDCVRLGRDVANGLEIHPRVVLQIGLPIIRRRATARRLTELLVCVAASAIQETPVPAVYAEGGATAAELARRMVWKRLKIVRELSPGVAMFEIDSTPGVTLTIKPGSYLWPDALLQS